MKRPDNDMGDVHQRCCRWGGPCRRGGRGSQTTTWVMCVIVIAGRVALVEEVSKAVGTWVTWTMMCIVDAGGVALVKEVSRAIRMRMTMCVINTGGVALVKEVSEVVETQVMWTTTCIVVDAGRVVLIEEVDKVSLL